MDYSENEKRLLAHFDVTAYGNPLLLYTVMASKAFTSNDQTPYAESLRRAVLHLEHGGDRGTPEFEKLIEIPTSSVE